MVALPIAAVGGGLAVLGGTVLAYYYDGGDDRVAEVEAALADGSPAPTDAPLRSDPEVTGVHEVAEHDDGDPGTPPVDWGEPINYEAEGSAGATVAATAGAGV